VGRVASVLEAVSAALRASNSLLLAAVLAALTAWDALAGRLPTLQDRWDVALIAALLLPATFLVVWLLLPFASIRWLGVAAAACGALAVLLDVLGLDAGFNVAKIVTFALLGFVFLQLFEALSWVVLVAAVIPWVDVVSVYRGPTRVVIEEEPGIFERIAVAFALPGEEAAARVGPPDVLFFALFLATAKRFGLRVTATWIAMTAAISATLVATYVFDLNGLPALPAVTLGFLVPNADLLWHAARGRDAARPRPG
jgi:hypothetical protein